MKKYLFLFLIGFNFISMNINAGENTTVSLENRIQKTEVEIETVKKQYSDDLGKIENKYQEKLDEIINEKNELRTKFNILMFIAGILGIGLVTFVNNSKKKIYEKMYNDLKVNKDSIEDIVRKYDDELKIKKTKKICILSVDNENKGDITKILKGFDGREYKSINDDINFDDYDLILINHNDDYDMDKINNLITEKLNNYFFYYGSGKVISGNMKKNFCNSIFTLYGNLIDLLRTQDLLNK